MPEQAAQLRHQIVANISFDTVNKGKQLGALALVPDRINETLSLQINVRTGERLVSIPLRHKNLGTFGLSINADEAHTRRAIGGIECVKLLVDLKFDFSDECQNVRMFQSLLSETIML